MYQGLLILQSHIIGLCFVQSIIVSYFNFDKVVGFAIVLGHPIEDALGTISALTTIAIELILASLMLLAHTIVTAPIRDIYSLMRAHNLSYLVVHEKVTWLATHHHHVLWLVDFQVSVVTKVGGIILTELGCLI
jgi:hypothetical protein